MSEMYVNNRKNFEGLMKDGSMVIIFGGTAPVKRGDEFYQFAPQRNFFYMTGIERPGLVFLQKKDMQSKAMSRLYIERFDELTAKWDGAAMSKEQAKEISGLESYAYLDELYGHLARMIVGERIHTVYLDLENRSFFAPNTPELDFAELLRKKFPAVTIENAHPMFAGLRMIKSEYEVENITKAAKITGEGFKALLSNVRPGMKEYELEAHLDYTYKKNGCKDRAFRTIMAGGKNACVLHYSDNNCEIGENDLVLVDFGAHWNWYSSDVSRTFPASGKFTERQKLLYNIVLEGNKLILDMIKPGVAFGKLQESLQAYYVTELTKIGLIKDKSELSKYYFHGVSHMLGLETHDVGMGSTAGSNELILAPGMVLTVEPGLYIEEESIGIRIEDNIVVTETGCHNITADIIKEIDDIEAFMAK